MIWQEKRLWEQVRGVGFTGSDFTALDSCDKETAGRVLLILLEWACYGQNVNGIGMGRKKVAEVPRDWLAAHIVEVVRNGFEYADDWNYRRLLEVVNQTVPEVTAELLALNADSGDPEIQDVIEDYQ